MHRLKRHRQYEIKLDIKDEQFIAPPRDTQRQWLINRALTEFCWDLEALDRLAARFVPGRRQMVLEERNPNHPEPEDIMELWQTPIMQAMVDLATEKGGDILEIGYGRGVSAAMIQQKAIKSHTIVECVPAIARHCERWIKEKNLDHLRLLEGRWEDVQSDFEQYDGIFFHTYPMDSEEYAKMARTDATLAEPFFTVAAAHLKKGGIFTYFSNEIDALSRSHQRALLRSFSEFSVSVCENLDLPRDVKDSWWINQMLIVAAR